MHQPGFEPTAGCYAPSSSLLRPILALFLGYCKLNGYSEQLSERKKIEFRSGRICLCLPLGCQEVKIIIFLVFAHFKSTVLRLGYFQYPGRSQFSNNFSFSKEVLAKIWYSLFVNVKVFAETFVICVFIL